MNVQVKLQQASIYANACDGDLLNALILAIEGQEAVGVFYDKEENCLKHCVDVGDSALGMEWEIQKLLVEPNKVEAWKALHTALFLLTLEPGAPKNPDDFYPTKPPLWYTELNPQEELE